MSFSRIYEGWLKSSWAEYKEMCYTALVNESAGAMCKKFQVKSFCGISSH